MQLDCCTARGQCRSTLALVMFYQLLLFDQIQFFSDCLVDNTDVLLVKGGEKVLLHFIQDSPGDHVPLEDICKAVGISATVPAAQRPVVRSTSGNWWWRHNRNNNHNNNNSNNNNNRNNSNNNNNSNDNSNSNNNSNNNNSNNNSNSNNNNSNSGVSYRRCDVRFSFTSFQTTVKVRKQLDSGLRTRFYWWLVIKPSVPSLRRR